MKWKLGSFAVYTDCETLDLNGMEINGPKTLRQSNGNYATLLEGLGYDVPSLRLRFGAQIAYGTWCRTRFWV